MIKAFPPRRPLGSWWAALAVATGLLLPAALVPARAQDEGTPPKKAKTAADPGASKTKADPAAEAAEDAKAEAKATAKKADSPDRWEDPNAAAALKNDFPQLPSALSTPAEKTQIDRLAAGQGPLDRAVIDRYVKNRAAALTSHANIKSLQDPEAKPDAAKALERATSELMGPLLVPLSGGNAAFRKEYVAKLIEVFKPIWVGNLHSRTMAMIVLSRCGDPQAVPVFIAQLNDPKQLAIVKLLSAVGITNVTENGHRQLDGSQAIPAARALSDFLRREPETFWPAQFRAMEALGSLRLSTEQPTSVKAEFADTAMRFLTDPKAPPQVRAWAGWALGFMDVPPSIRTYNFPLVALSMGRAAADIGTLIAEMPDGSMLRVVRLTNLLIQLHQGFTGEPDIRGSGLSRSVHPAFSGSQSVVAEVERRVRALTRAALDLSTAVGSQIAEKRKGVVAAVNDLKGYLAKPPAHAKSLYTGGPTFPDPQPPKVAAGVRG